MADYGLPLYGDAIIVNSAFAANYPEALKGFLRAFLKGLKETIRSRRARWNPCSSGTKMPHRDIELERLRMVIRDNIVTEEVQANGLGGVDPERFARGIDLCHAKLKAEGQDRACGSVRCILPSAPGRTANGARAAGLTAELWSLS